MSLDKRINGYLVNFSDRNDNIVNGAVKGLKIGAGVGAGLGAVGGGISGLMVADKLGGPPLAGVIGGSTVGALKTGLKLGAVGALIGAAIRYIKKSDVKDDKYYVIKNDKVMNEFNDRDRANQYAAVHDAYVNKGTTLKEKVGK